MKKFLLVAALVLPSVCRATYLDCTGDNGTSLECQRMLNFQMAKTTTTLDRLSLQVDGSSATLKDILAFLVVLDSHTVNGFRNPITFDFDRWKDSPEFMTMLGILVGLSFVAGLKVNA